MTSARWAKPKDISDIGRISARCFPGDSPVERAERIRKDPRISPGDILVVEVGGRIAGGATLIPQKVWTGGVEHPMGGVASVQVDPDFRRRGVAQAAMRRLFEAHRERGYPLSLLYPYDPAFYRRLGYATIERYVELSLRTSALPASEDAQFVRTASAVDLDAVIDCHRRSLPAHNGGMDRSRGMWECRVLDPKRAIAVFEREGRIDGYFIYEMSRTDDCLQQLMTVREWVAPDGAAMRALLGYLALQQAQCGETRLFAAVDDPLLLFLAEPRSPQYSNPIHGRYSSGGTGTASMGRVTDLAALFGAGRPFVGPAGTCLFRTVERVRSVDGTMEDCVEEVSVEFDGAHAEVTKKRASSLLECDPGTMAQIYFGAAKPSEAVRFGQARIEPADAVAALDRLFAQSAPFFHPLDYF